MADNNSNLQDDELYLPRTVVNKLIKEIVPNIRVSTDARDLLLNCCTEFIHLLASEASDISERQQKKVISPEHVVEALTTLGFQEYVPDVKAVHKEYKEQASKHRKRGKSKLDRLGIPEEELARQQQQLFDEARQQQIESELLEQQKVGHQLQSLSTTEETEPKKQCSSNLTTPVPNLLSASVQQSAPNPVPEGTKTTNFVEATTLIKQHSSVTQTPSMTAASIQATSSLLQQALAMAASAQVVATTSMQSTAGQTDITQQNLLLKHMTTQLLPQQPDNPEAKARLQDTLKSISHSTGQGKVTGTPTSSKLSVDTPVVTSQELSVAQMMMTLAQASNRNASIAHNGSNQTAQISNTKEHP